MEQMKNYILLMVVNPVGGAVGATILSALNFLYGTGITLTAVGLFACIVVMDWVAGYRAAKKDGSFASEYGIDGAFRTSFILILIAIAYRVDVALGLPYILFFYLLGNFTLPMWKSMTANVYRAGWERWIPQKVLNSIADEIAHKTARAEKRLKEKTGQGDE